MKQLFLSLLLLSGMACGGSSFEIPEPLPGKEEPQQPTDDEQKDDIPNEDKPNDDSEAGIPVVTQGMGTLVADGMDADTYALIRAQGYNYETSDNSGSHASEPFRHITQAHDEELDRWVFLFHIHAAIDDDRGMESVTDRQRNEIKTDAKSPAEMVAQEGETLEMRWKFRLPEGMVTTTKFCHLHQLKGIDNATATADVAMPLITFTARSLSAGTQQFQVIFVPPTEEGGSNQYLARVDLADFLGEWVYVVERVTFAREGSYEAVITRLSDGKELVRISDRGRNFWRTGTTGLRPKWGIYRSVGEQGTLREELRDEVLRFADFEIVKL